MVYIISSLACIVTVAPPHVWTHQHDGGVFVSRVIVPGLHKVNRIEYSGTLSNSSILPIPKQFGPMIVQKTDTLNVLSRNVVGVKAIAEDVRSTVYYNMVLARTEITVVCESVHALYGNRSFNVFLSDSVISCEYIDEPKPEPVSKTHLILMDRVPESRRDYTISSPLALLRKPAERSFSLFLTSFWHEPGATSIHYFDDVAIEPRQYTAVEFDYLIAIGTRNKCSASVSLTSATKDDRHWESVGSRQEWDLGVVGKWTHCVIPLGRPKANRAAVSFRIAGPDDFGDLWVDNVTLVKSSVTSDTP